MRHHRLLATVLLGTALLGATEAHATFTLTFDQVGADVVATGSGSLHLAGLTFSFTNAIGGPGINPTTGIYLGALGPVDLYTGFFGPSSFGSGTGTSPNSITGDSLGVIVNHLVVPQGYTSGTPLSSSETFDNATFASLGITPGIYTWTWGTTDIHDSFVLEIGPVPEPASLALLGAGLAGIGVMSRRRRS